MSGSTKAPIVLVSDVREYSLREAARVMARRTDEVLRLIEKNELSAYFEGRQWRIPEWSIKAYQERRCAADLERRLAV